MDYDYLQATNGRGRYVARGTERVKFHAPPSIALQQRLHAKMMSLKDACPIYQFPTTVVLVADNKSYLDEIALNIQSVDNEKSRLTKRFFDPTEALSWVSETDREFSGYLDLDKQCINNPSNLDGIYERVYVKNRFKFPSVLVVDYAMAKMDGLSLCHEMARFPCKKILLTDHASESIVIDALNRDIIDLYINKADPSAMSVLKESIFKMERSVFNDMSALTRKFTQSHIEFSFLDDPEFLNMVDALAVEYGFVERYLLGRPSGFVFFDADGNSKVLIVETRDGLEAHLDVARDMAASSTFIDGLKNAALVPFFPKGELYTEKLHDCWSRYCKPAQLCLGNEEYFYALFDVPESFITEPILSYNAYMSAKLIV